MSRRLTNKQIAVLQVLRAQGETTCKRVSEIISHGTPCATCNGTAQGDHPDWGCGSCYGTGRVLFSYETAHLALTRLRTLGLVAKRPVLDAFGDATGRIAWAAEPVAKPDDPLEALFLASSAAREDPA